MPRKKESSCELIKKEILVRFEQVAEPIINKLNEIIQNLKDKKDQKVALITHNVPDPDAISSALVLKRFLKSAGVETEVFTNNLEFISRETKTIINTIGIHITPSEQFNPDIHKSVILVDVASLNQSNVDPKNLNVDLVIDHHNDETPFESTATIITLLMEVMGFELTKELATALLVGLEIDTLQCTAAKFTDFDDLAFKILSNLRDVKLRREIVQCGYSESYREILTRALSQQYFRKEGSTVVSGVGFVPETQLSYLPKVANFILDEDGVERVTILAIVEKEVKDDAGDLVTREYYIVPTTRSSSGIENAGELNKKVFGEKVAGGDPVKASGRIPLDPTMEKLIERAKSSGDESTLEKYFQDILKLYLEKILEKQTQ